MEHPARIAAIEVRRRHELAGPRQLSALDRHRVVLHLSQATRTSCMTTGHRALRTRGDIDIVAADTVDGFEANSGYSSLEILVAPGLLQRVAEECDLPLRHADLTNVHLLRDERLQGILMALDADLSSGPSRVSLFQESMEVSLAMALLLREATPGHATPPVHAMQRVVDYIEAHLDHPLTIARLAGVAGVSPSSLQRSFKQWRGLAVHRYVVQRRVERARLLIDEGRAPQAEVALMTGFAHQSHMARWLRRLDQTGDGRLDVRQ